jgi:predicted Rossmann fold nucleotide-binding protein DprA/Smf involved in DNA uptake
LENSLKNFHQASRELKEAMEDLGPRSKAVARNLEQASETIKRQPWRLIWPSSKEYPKGSAKSDGPDRPLRGTPD